MTATMADPKRTHEREQRAAQAVDLADTAAAFYHALRARKVPASAAAGCTEAWVSAMAGGDVPPEWTT